MSLYIDVLYVTDVVNVDATFALAVSAPITAVFGFISVSFPSKHEK